MSGVRVVLLALALLALGSLARASSPGAAGAKGGAHSHADGSHVKAPLRVPDKSLKEFVGNAQARRILEVLGTTITASLLTVNLTATENVEVGGIVTAGEIESNYIGTDTLRASVLKSPTGVVSINGNLQFTQHEVEFPETAKPPPPPDARFKATRATVDSMLGQGEARVQPNVRGASFLAESVVVRGVKQWQLVRHDNFDSGNDGWSMLETSSCSAGSADRFLGGHCNIANGAVKKTFRDLPPHEQVRVTGRYHFIDNWQGEAAFLTLDQHYVWTDHAGEQSQAAARGQARVGIEMCGNDRFPETRMSVPVDVTLPHSASLLEVAFGSKGRDLSEDPCQRSFGVDDVMVYVK